MCGPADFHALGLSLARLTALSVAGGGLYTAVRIRRLIEEMRERQDADTQAPAGNETGSR